MVLSAQPHSEHGPPRRLAGSLGENANPKDMDSDCSPEGALSGEQLWLYSTQREEDRFSSF